MPVEGGVLTVMLNIDLLLFLLLPPTHGTPQTFGNMTTYLLDTAVALNIEL
jgi:hypothetical protein